VDAMQLSLFIVCVCLELFINLDLLLTANCASVDCLKIFLEMDPASVHILKYTVDFTF